MATITYDSETPGRGGQGGPLFAAGSARMKVVTGRFSFDSSYPTGGEDLADIASQFKGNAWFGMLMAQPIQAGAQTGKFVSINASTKKAQLFTNASPFAEVANASDQSAIVNLPFIGWGPA